MKQLCAFLTLLLIISACSQNKGEQADESTEKRLLFFSKTMGFRHQSIPAAKAAMLKLSAEKGFAADTTETTELFNVEDLNDYDAIIFLLSSGDVLNETEQEAFISYIQNGGGYVGVHSACDTEYDWPWYGELVGGYFESHPKPQDAAIDVIVKDHPATAHLPERWNRLDEWYNFKNLNPKVTVLATLDESSYEGGKHGDNHPIAWYHSFDGGKAFFTALGHTDESYSEENFLKHVWGGIDYVTSD